MKQFFIVTVGVVVVVGAIFFMARSKNEDEQLPVVTSVATISPENYGEFVAIAPLTTPTTIVAVSMSDEAFEPSTLTISAGDTVVFTNNGQALHWPASNPHPVHNNLPTFDAKKGLATGETYSYAFMEPGTFGMHDHVNAKIKGTIVVE